MSRPVHPLDRLRLALVGALIVGAALGAAATLISLAAIAG